MARASMAGAERHENQDLMADRAHEGLLGRLRDGRLRSGAFLSIPMLVETIGLPIAAVRDAVKRAEAAGLLVVLPKRGVMVMEATPLMTRECLDLRAILDCEGARRLIQGGLPPRLATLRRAHEDLRVKAQRRASTELSPMAIATDLSLHDLLAEGLQSGLARRVYAENRDRIAIVQNSRPFLPDRIALAMSEHLAIIDAVEQLDAEKACQAVRHHLQQTLRWWGVAG